MYACVVTFKFGAMSLSTVRPPTVGLQLRVQSDRCEYLSAMSLNSSFQSCKVRNSSYDSGLNIVTRLMTSLLVNIKQLNIVYWCTDSSHIVIRHCHVVTKRPGVDDQVLSVWIFLPIFVWGFLPHTLAG